MDERTENFELVRYPFKVGSVEDVILYRVDPDCFEMRFTRDVFSKRVRSTLSDTTRWFVVIEVEGNSTRIIGKTDRIHEFETPADFYIANDANSMQFYRRIHSLLIGENFDDFLKQAVELEETVKVHGFPEIVPPSTTTTMHFENYETAVGKVGSMPKIPIVQIRHGDAVPGTCRRKAQRLLTEYLSADQMEAQDEFYKRFFENTPIARFKTAADEYGKDSTGLQKRISINYLKRCISLHAYFVISGPWRKCWIRFCYDPTSDPQNYRYQVVELRSKHANFQIFQRPEVVSEVSMNTSWYLLARCDPVDGFASKALKNLIVYTLDNAGSRNIDKKIDDLQDSDFDIFEM